MCIVVDSLEGVRKQSYKEIEPYYTSNEEKCRDQKEGHQFINDVKYLQHTHKKRKCEITKIPLDCV